MNRPILARMLARLLLLVMIFGGGLAHAHKASDAYLTLTVQPGGRIEQRLDVALRDLDRVLDLGADEQGQLRWGALRARWGALEQLVDGSVRLVADGLPCTRVATGAPMLDDHADGRHAVLSRHWQCGVQTPATLDIDYRLFEHSDASHRGIARIDVAGRGEPLTRVLVPGEPATVRLGPAADATGWRRALVFFGEGLHHIAAGADHLLFLATLMLVAVWQRQGPAWAPRVAARATWLEALRLVTAFTASHSVTLGLAAAGVLAPPSRWVESLIAVSVFVAALDNIRPFLPGPRWAMAAVFGLVHGFGFAGPLQDLGLRGGDLAWPLLGFNLGVEAGQLIVVALLLPLALAWRAKPAYRRWVVRPGSGLVAGLALLWTVERVFAWPLLPALG